MNKITDVFMVVNQRKILDELRLNERNGLTVIKKRLEICRVRDEHYNYLQLIKKGHEWNIVELAKAIGECDKLIAEITEDMEKSANRQKGADND